MFGTIKLDSNVNVYAEPRPDSEVICQIPGGTRIEVEPVLDVNKFYRIYTSMGIEGFCMKKHVLVEQ